MEFGSKFELQKPQTPRGKVCLRLTQQHVFINPFCSVNEDHRSNYVWGKYVVFGQTPQILKILRCLANLDDLGRGELC